MFQKIETNILLIALVNVCYLYSDDDTAELLRELQKIRKERKEEQEKKVCKCCTLFAT